MKHWKRFISCVAALAFASAGLVGCSGDDGDSSANPNPNKFNPKGTVQGKLLDSSTNDPIVGAVVSIGVAKATTDKDGHFVMKNVPASYDALNGTVSGSYAMSVNLSGVSSPIDMRKAETSPRYPTYANDFSVSVAFTSLDDTSGDEPGAGSGSNHDTPVDGLLAEAGVLYVGKLSTSITGCVVSMATLARVDTEYTVSLISRGSNNNATGNNGLVLATTTTTDGEFSFSGVEAYESFYVSATNGVMVSNNVSVSTSADGTTNSDLMCGDTCESAVWVYPIDQCGPFIVSCTPEFGSDLAPTEGQAVVFTFSEPVKANVYATNLTPETSMLMGLWNDVEVMKGSKADLKAGNTAHSMAWNDDMTQLTVTIAQTTANSVYGVGITGSDAYDGIMDVAGNTFEADLSVCTSTAFTTNTVLGTLAEAPVVALVDDTLDYDDVPVLDWLPTVGAKGYTVYCAVEQVWGETSTMHETVLVGGNTEFNEGFLADTMFYDESLCGLCDGEGCEDFLDFAFIEAGDIALRYNYTVKGVNVDGVESAASNAVVAEDTVAPEISSLSASVPGFPADGQTNTNTWHVYFSEPVTEATGEVLANYTLSLSAGVTATPDFVMPTLTAVERISQGHYMLSVAVTNPTGGTEAGVETSVTLMVSNVTDVAGNVIATTGDQWFLGADPVPPDTGDNPF